MTTPDDEALMIAKAEPRDVEPLYEITATWCPPAVRILSEASARGRFSSRAGSAGAAFMQPAAAPSLSGGYFLRSNFPAMAGHIAQSGYLVARAERGRGIGTGLVAHSMREAGRHGYTAMMFNLVQEYNPSRRLYERAGFQVIGRIPHVHGDEAGLIYWRELPAQE